MSKKSRTRRSRSRSRSRSTRKQKIINMIGCSKKHRHNKSCKDLGCSNCGQICHCSNRKKSQKGGSGCGSCGCPVGGFTYKDMNKFGGNKFGGAYNYPKDFNNPVLINGLNTNEFIGIPGIAQKGGCGGTCGLQQSGGNFYKPAAPMPGPFVGSSWNTKVNEWPGMNGIGSDRNYLNSYSNTISKDPQLQMLLSDADAGYKTLSSMVGGKKNKRKSQRGGLIPQDLVNLGRTFSFNAQSAYNSLNGYNQPVNPMPYKDQLLNNKLPI